MIVPLAPLDATRPLGAPAPAPAAPAPAPSPSVSTDSVPAPGPSDGITASPFTPAKSCTPLTVAPAGCQAVAFSEPNGIVTCCQPVKVSGTRASHRSEPAS